MKSSTLHRSNLTQERMELLRAIKEQKRNSSDSAPGIYVRPAKEKELDVLWQSFKVNQKDEKSPAIYMVTGFIVGAIAMFLMTALISFAAHTFSGNSGLNLQPAKTEKAPKITIPKPETKSKDASINFLPPDTAKASSDSDASKMMSEEYTIKPGDTLGSIALRFLGSSDPESISKIAEANKITNPERINIGQVLVIPAE